MWLQIHFFVVFLRNAYMVYLMIIRRSREIFKIMGHDVKQFKSLEGFLESGPQFVLQSYILLLGKDKNSYTNREECKSLFLFRAYCKINSLKKLINFLFSSYLDIDLLDCAVVHIAVQNRV